MHNTNTTLNNINTCTRNLQEYHSNNDKWNGDHKGDYKYNHYGGKVYDRREKKYLKPAPKEKKPLTRGATVYTGCGYTYADKANRDAQCGDGGTSKWIDDRPLV